MSILHFRKQLATPPVAIEVPGIRVRTFAAPDDIEPWLALRTRAVADFTPTARPWSLADFRQEMSSKPWWRPDHTWLAIAGDLRVARTWEPNAASGESSSPANVGEPARYLVGSVTLALREGTSATIPVVHWLLVDPTYQRQGIARSLIGHLELAAWNAGHREIQLETHTNWRSAVAFYHSAGYAPLRKRSPR